MIDNVMLNMLVYNSLYIYILNYMRYDWYLYHLNITYIIYVYSICIIAIYI